MPFYRILALTWLILSGSVASAFDITAMSDEERAAFRAEIRAYLLQNPEVIFEAVEVFEASQAAQQTAAETDIIAANRAAIFDDGHSWVGGNPDGDVTLVEFIDYRCGFCRRAAPEVEKLLQADDNLRLVVKEFPILGAESVLMSRFAIAVHQVAGDAAYKQAHDVLMSATGEISSPRLRRIAEDLELDAEAVLAQMQSPDVTQVIAQNRALAQRLNIAGTPSFVLEDQILRGFLPAAQMASVIAQKRARD